MLQTVSARAIQPWRAAPRIVAVVVTHDRPALLRRCLAAIEAQTRRPDLILVVDDASPGTATAEAIAAFPRVRHLRHRRNAGGAAAYRTGLAAALAEGARFAWLMDDDGRPADRHCLARLLDLAAEGYGIAAPIVLDEAAPARLAFPLRIAGRTRFTLDALERRARVEGRAHLFNGTLVAAAVPEAIGLPDARFEGRGDEVEFLLRARRAGFAVATGTAARFLHPGSAPEIHPILFGAFYATVPLSPAKRAQQFRNRAWIFSRNGLWPWLAADAVRYASHYLLRRRPDPRGFGAWLAATAGGLGGGFMRIPAETPEVEQVAAPRAAVQPQKEPAHG